MPTSEYEKMRRRYPVQVERFCRACPNYMLQLGWDGTRYCDACGWHGLHAARPSPLPFGRRSLT